MPTVHHLKTWPQYFKLMQLGLKTFEFRRDDRNFRQGDLLILQEWEPDVVTVDAGRFTGRIFKCVVRLVLRDVPGMPEGYCIMQVERDHR